MSPTKYRPEGFWKYVSTTDTVMKIFVLENKLNSIDVNFRELVIHRFVDYIGVHPIFHQLVGFVKALWLF